MGAKGNFYVTQKRTEANTKTYGDEYHSRRDVKETATNHRGNEEEEDEEPTNKPKSEKEVRNGNAFGRANNRKVV